MRQRFIYSKFVSYVDYSVCYVYTYGIIKTEHQAASTIIILSAMPSATLNVIMGQKYDNNPKFAACAIMQNTLIMLVTLPLFVWICSK